MTIEGGLNTFGSPKTVLQLRKKFKPLIKKRNTKHETSIPFNIKVVCSFYKLSHGVEYFQCIKLFAINKSLMNMVLHEFVCPVNENFKSQVWCRSKDDLLFQVMASFKEFYGLLFSLWCDWLHLEPHWKTYWYSKSCIIFL